MTTSTATPGTFEGRTKAAQWKENLALAMVVIAISGFYFWSAALQTPTWVSREPRGYYNLLTDAFLARQLHLKVEPDPNLLRLSDPYDPVANAPYRVHDATLYRGHYYLYYGVTPAVLLYFPWAWSTGTFLTDVFVVPFFGALGLAAAAWLLVGIWRRHFPCLHWSFVALGEAVVGLGTMVPLLMQGQSFYAVPISCAFACSMVALACLYRAIFARRLAGAWLASASLAFGFAMGARPDFVLAAALVFVPVLAWLVWFQDDSLGFFNRRTAVLLWDAYGPIAGIGVALLLYNYLRFDSLFEFGVKYQLAGQSQRHLVVYGPHWFLGDITHYLFAAIHPSPYFPFLVLPGWTGFGMLIGAPMVWLGWLALAACFHPGLGERGRFGVLVSMIGAVAWANLIMVCFHYTQTERYMVDFLAAFVLLGVIGGLALTAIPHRSAGPRRSAAWVYGITATITMGVSLAVSATRCVEPAILQPLARVLNRPVGWWQQMTRRRFGPLDLEVVFPRRPAMRAEALVGSGASGGQCDVVYVEYLDEKHVCFHFFHSGVGGPVSAPLEIEPGRSYRVGVFFGGLLPPAAHSIFSGWDARTIWVAHRTVWVDLEGRRVLETAVEPYPSRPWDTKIGGMKHALNEPIRRTFSGQVRIVDRRPLHCDDFKEPTPPGAGPLAMEFLFPYAQGGREPLVATGQGRKGDLLYVDHIAPGRLRFHFLHAGYGGPASAEVTVASDKPQHLLVWMGSFAATGAASEPQGSLPLRNRLLVTFEGKTIFDQRQEFYPAGSQPVAIGRDTLGLGVTEHFFGGRVLSIASFPYTALPAYEPTGSYGAVEMMVLFPQAPPQHGEPLVVTGRPGAGDFIYVRYEGTDTVRFGSDHWGISSALGEPVKVDFSRPHRLEITMGSLYATTLLNKLGYRRLGRLTEVRLDGRVVLSDDLPCNPSLDQEIKLGVNLIGGSTCSPDFTGKILSVARTDVPRWLSLASPGPQ